MPNNIWNIRSLSRINRIWGGWVSQDILPRAYLFDGVNDYIAWDTTIGRTGYDLNVSGNVSVGSDSDWSYFWFKWNRDATWWTWTLANMRSSSVVFNQDTSFSVGMKLKMIANTWAGRYGGIWGEDSWSCFYINTYQNNNQIRVVTKPSYSADTSIAYTLWTVLTIHIVYDSSVKKVYCYKDWVLQNSGWTAMSSTFNLAEWFLWDSWCETTVVDSSERYIYWNAVRNVALTQAEVTADVALWNTAKTDSRIVAYYIPENLQYNTQYLSNPKDLSNATWTKGTGTTVTADFSTAPDGTNTADKVVWTGTDIATSRCDRTFTTLSGLIMSSKTFIVKAFVKVAAGTALFRLRCSHNWVADYYSSNQTATTTRQEFTFTQAFTSSTSWTGITAWLVIESWLSAATLEVWNVRLFVNNETLRDESPNIGNFIGRKTNIVMSLYLKPTADAAWSTADTQCLIKIPWRYMHIRTTNNTIQFRNESRLWAFLTGTDLTNWFRSKVHLLWYFYWNWSTPYIAWYKNWAYQWVTNFWQADYRPSTLYNTNIQCGKSSSVFFSWYEWDIRLYKVTTYTDFTDADVLAIYNWWEPSTAVKYLQWKPNSAEWWTTARDRSGNLRTWTLTGGVTRVAVPAS